MASVRVVDDEPDDWTDDEAFVRAAQADIAAFEPLYARYADSVFRFCLRRLGERAAAEDATARIFERAIAALPRYRAGSFRGWLFTIARNEVATAYRRDRGDLPLILAESLHDSHPGPEPVAIAREEAVWVRGLLARLPEPERQVVELRLAGLNDREIAEALGKSHGAVRTRQYRALLRLRELLGRSKDGGDG